MKNSYNIYFATNRLVISDNPTELAARTIPVESAPESVEDLCRMLSTHKFVEIVTPCPKETFDKIAGMFIDVCAAGGVATNSKGEALMIFRNGRWDLPKGHWEEGETIEECATREVEEETGVDGLTIQSKICQTIHIYNMKGRWEMKTTHWYSMSTSYAEALTPQIEEGIEQVRWCTQEEILSFLPDSYPTIQQVFAQMRER